MKKILTGIMILCLSMFLFAEDTGNTSGQERVLTVEDAVALALSNNLKVKQSEMDLEILELKNKYSWNSVSPSISFSGGYNGSYGGTITDFSNTAAASNSWSASAALNLSLSPSLATTMKAAQLAYESGEATLETTKRTIELSVRKTFYSLLYYNENVELQERSLETAKQTYESNKTKYNQGRLSELNLLNSQYSYESKIPTVENLKNTFENNLAKFKVDLGIPLSEKIKLTGNLEELSSFNLDDSILQSSLDNIPAVQTIRRNIESAENSLQATKYSAYGPSLSLSGSTGLSGSFGGSSSAMGGSSDPRLAFSYSASVRVPLDGFLPWSSGALSIESQKENLEKLKMNLDNEKTSAEISLQNSYNAIKQAKKQLELYEKNVVLMQKTYDMTLNSYNHGSTDLLSLQNAENNLFSAKYNVQNQRYTIISSLLDMENTLGLKFGTLNTK